MKIDYVAKSRTESDVNFILANLFATLYICYSYWIMLYMKGAPKTLTVFLFLIAFLAFCMFKIIDPDMKTIVEEAKKFLENTGQEATNANINLIVGRYYEEYRGDWLKKIANILNARQEVPNFENLKHLEDSNK